MAPALSTLPMCPKRYANRPATSSHSSSDPSTSSGTPTSSREGRGQTGGSDCRSESCGPLHGSSSWRTGMPRRRAPCFTGKESARAGVLLGHPALVASGLLSGRRRLRKPPPFLLMACAPRWWLGSVAPSRTHARSAQRISPGELANSGLDRIARK